MGGPKGTMLHLSFSQGIGDTLVHPLWGKHIDEEVFLIDNGHILYNYDTPPLEIHLLAKVRSFS